MTKKRNIIINKGGRPRLPEYQKNSIQIHVKISPALDAYLNEQATLRYKGKRNDYIRSALWGRWVRELVTPEFNKLLHDLSNMGNNVKYLRDWFFKHNMEPEGNQCKEILDGLSRILEEARHRRQLADKENAEARTVPDNRTNAL